jgi:cell division protein FtsL
MAEEAKMALFTCVVAAIVMIIGIIYNDRRNN